ncbi:PEP-CTERM sorting domain-containing protein [Paraglaciecola sp. L3A3]|nr:PEP-CTERM sorting domain-containing protein [Paraglaciecola sp. L3A3]
MTYSSPSTEVPVPPTFSLLMLGLLAAVGVRKKR